MAHRVLCDDGLRVVLEKVGDRLHLSVSNGTLTTFLTDASTLEDALSGAPLQLSSPDAYCHIERQDERVLLTFGLRDSGRKTCSVAASEFAEATTWARRDA